MGRNIGNANASAALSDFGILQFSLKIPLGAPRSGGPGLVDSR